MISLEMIHDLGNPVAGSVHALQGQNELDNYRDEQFKKRLAKLKEAIIKANLLIRDANFMATDMGQQIKFQVTLQIPAQNLTATKINMGAFISEPAILVECKNKRRQIWSMEKLEDKLICLRDLDEEWKERPKVEPKAAPSASEDGSGGQLTTTTVEVAKPPVVMNPFYDSQENHNLIGVTNVFLEVLFHNVKLDYLVPIINQQFEVAGRLHVEIYRVDSPPPPLTNVNESRGAITDYLAAATEATEDAMVSSTISNASPNGGYHSTHITCRVCIREATGLPPAKSDFVFCQYSFWGVDKRELVLPKFDGSVIDAKLSNGPHSGITYKFDHSKDFKVTVNDEFLEHVHEGALSIEVWGHRSTLDVHNLNAVKSRILQERWAKVTRRLELWVQILELNDKGDFVPVDLVKGPETGGEFQLRQAQQRHVHVRVAPIPNTGLLPLVCTQIMSVEMGGICTRSKTLPTGLNSYQEKDSNILRKRWSEALTHRREYLDDQIQRLMHKPNKCDQDVEREQALIAQWMMLTQERNAALVPTPNSGVPGAPTDWELPSGMERDVPVLFLDLNSDDMGTTAGLNSILPEEHGNRMRNLQILRREEEVSRFVEGGNGQRMGAVSAWDSSIHEHPALNRLTPETERVYAIIKVVVSILQPRKMKIVLRKRLCFHIVKRNSLSSENTHCGVIYEIVSNVPKTTEELEVHHEILAQVAARSEEERPGPLDEESYIEKYTKGISGVEKIFALDRLRQEGAIKELLSAQKRHPKKSSTLPEGFSHVGSGDGLNLSGGQRHRMSIPQEKRQPTLPGSGVIPVGGDSQSSLLATPTHPLTEPTMLTELPISETFVVNRASLIHPHSFLSHTIWSKTISFQHDKDCHSYEVQIVESKRVESKREHDNHSRLVLKLVPQHDLLHRQFIAELEVTLHTVSTSNPVCVVSRKVYLGELFVIGANAILGSSSWLRLVMEQSGSELEGRLKIMRCNYDADVRWEITTINIREHVSYLGSALMYDPCELVWLRDGLPAVCLLLRNAWEYNEHRCAFEKRVKGRLLCDILDRNRDYKVLNISIQFVNNIRRTAEVQIHHYTMYQYNENLEDVNWFDLCSLADLVEIADAKCVIDLSNPLNHA